MTKRTKLEGLQPRRKRAGMTQADVAEALGIERATVGMWETGTSWPSARVLPDLAGLLCCSIDELYTAPEAEEPWDPSTRPVASLRMTAKAPEERIATPSCATVRNDRTEEGAG